jgi:phosphatidate phosphatase APP1
MRSWTGIWHYRGNSGDYKSIHQRRWPDRVGLVCCSREVCPSIFLIPMDRKIYDWKARAEALVEHWDNLSDSLRSRLRKITGFNYPLMIMPYLGYGTPDKLLLSGRVLEDEGFMPFGGREDTWQNIVNMYRRFETDEVPGARIRALFQGVEKEVVADHEGYFTLEINPIKPLDSGPWHEVDLELLDPPSKDGQRIISTAQVLVPSSTATIGIISDVDDTVISTNVPNKLKMILTVTLLNEHTRKPFEGVAAFYRALQKGKSGSEENPIFYVSSSPWNLYTLLLEFLKVQEIPMGPLFLRDFGDHLLFSWQDRHSHKISNIRKLLDTYHHLPFVLIGDSGEQDPEIYQQIVKEYPKRVRVIYIRSVNRHPSRIKAIDKLVEEVGETACQLVLASDSEFAAAHAAAEGLISTGELPRIRSEKKNGKGALKDETLAKLV